MTTNYEGVNKPASNGVCGASCGSLCRCNKPGILILRIGAGGIITAHGIQLLLQGPEVRARIGQMAVGGLYPQTMGMLAAGIFALCGLLVVIGVWTTKSAWALSIVLLFAVIGHLRMGHSFFDTTDGTNGRRYALFMAITFLALGFMGRDKKRMCSTEKQCGTSTNTPTLKEQEKNVEAKIMQGGCCGGGCCADK